MSKAGRNCAFCGGKADLSREHLFPRCLYERIGTTLLENVSGKTEKVVTSEPTIRDVCRTCNGGPLSLLDSYACTLYDKYLGVLVRSGEIKFEYDFDLLLRWLLKIGYNTARARTWPFTFPEELKHYVLGRNDRPAGAHVLVQLIIPTKVEPGRIAGHPTTTEVPPIPNRVALLDARRLPGFVLAFMVSVYSYYFYVLRDDPASELRLRKRILKHFIRLLPGAYELRPQKKRAVLFASSLDFISAASQSDPFLRNLLLGRKWQEEKQRRRNAS